MSSEAFKQAKTQASLNTGAVIIHGEIMLGEITVREFPIEKTLLESARVNRATNIVE